MKSVLLSLVLTLAMTLNTTAEFQDYARKQVSQREFACLLKLWTKESNWRPQAASPTKDYGIPQRNMPRHTKKQIEKFRKDPKAQIDWGIGYIRHRYGDACKALNHHRANNWYLGDYVQSNRSG